MPMLAFIGAGNMAEAIARGILRATLFQRHEISAADPSADRQRLFSEDLGVACSADPRGPHAAILIERRDLVSPGRNCVGPKERLQRAASAILSAGCGGSSVLATRVTRLGSADLAARAVFPIRTSDLLFWGWVVAGEAATRCLTVEQIFTTGLFVFDDRLSPGWAHTLAPVPHNHKDASDAGRKLC